MRSETDQTDLNSHSDESNQDNDVIDDHEPVTEDESDIEIEQYEDSCIPDEKIQVNPRFWSGSEILV